jgi:hypothetical protein
VSADVNYARNEGSHLTKAIDLNKPKPLSASGKFMANWLGKASPAKIDKSSCVSPPKEGVKRQLSMKDPVQGTSARKIKEDEPSV